MATQTEKLGLLKPNYDELADIAVINRNMDKIDDYAKALDTNIDEAINEALEPKSNIGIPSVNSNNSYIKNVPDTSAPYAEISKVGGMSYKDGNTLRDARVTEVKSVGANLIPYPYDLSSGMYNGVTITFNNDGSFTFNGTATSASYLLLKRVILPAGTYYVSDSGNNDWKGKFYVSLPTENYFKDSSFTLTEPTLVDFRLAIYESFIGTATFYPMVNRGTEALHFAPYTEHTLAIPESVQSLEGYGLGVNDTYYNYIDFESKKFNRVVKKVVFNGTENWSGPTSNGDFVLYSSELSDCLKSQGLILSNKFYCAFYDTIYVNAESTGISTVEEFKALLSSDNLSIVLRIATPTTEHIPEISNLIGVEVGGTLTFENEYGYDVPYEVEFYLNSNEIVGAKKFVGDLLGTAKNAENATNAENAKTAETATKATYLSKGEWNRVDSSALGSIQYILDLDSWYLIEACKTVTDEKFCSSFVLHTPLELSTVTPTCAYSSASRGVKSGTTEDYTYVSVDHMPNYSANSYTFSYSGSCDYLRIRKIM